MSYWVEVLWKAVNSYVYIHNYHPLWPGKRRDWLRKDDLPTRQVAQANKTECVRIIMENMQDLSQYHKQSSIGAYQILQMLGSGSISRTYLVEHQDHPDTVSVLKIMEGVSPLTDQEQEQVLLEVSQLQHLQYLQDLHASRILEGGISDGTLYLVTAYVEGDSLRQRLAATPGTLLPFDEVLALLMKLGEALQFAHQQKVVHANLKPENILLADSGEILLADFHLFTLAQIARSATLLLLNTVSYMAPEQILHSSITARSDQYSLACIAWELLTGHPPFSGKETGALIADHLMELPVFPAGFNNEHALHLEGVLLKALAKRPEERYPSIKDFVTALCDPHLAAPAPEPTEPELASVDETPVAFVLPGPEAAQAAANAPTSPGESTILPLAASVSLPGSLHASLPAGLSSSAQKAGSLYNKRFWMVGGIVLLTLCIFLPGLFGVFLMMGKQLPNFMSLPASPTSQSRVLPPLPVQTASISRSTPGATPPPAATPAVVNTGPGCAVHYQIVSEWLGGFVVNMTITNVGTTGLDGWSLVFTFPNNQRVVNGWNGRFTQTGERVTIRNTVYNGQFPSGTTISSGFQGIWFQRDAIPTTFLLNGLTCTVS